MGGGLVTLEKIKVIHYREGKENRYRMKLMNFKRLLIGWLATGMLGGACERTKEAPKTEAPSAAKPTWLTNFDTAQARARSEKKLLLIEFTGSDWCPPCVMLERQVFSQPEFKEYAAQHLVLLEVDFPRMKELSDGTESRERKTGGTIWNRRIPDHHHPGLEGRKIGELGYMPGGPKPFIAALEELRATRLIR